MQALEGNSEIEIRDLLLGNCGPLLEHQVDKHGDRDGNHLVPSKDMSIEIVESGILK